MAYILNALGYSYNALEPNFDEETMHFHHDKHHAAYVNKLNALLSEKNITTNYSLDELIKNINVLNLDDTSRSLVRFNAGGHYNHDLFWQVLTPGGGRFPSKILLTALTDKFGGLENFISSFEKSALSHLGSGWTWLCVDSKNHNDLFICSTLNHDNPLMNNCVERNGYPILLLDLWEHAYYLKYKNNKADYIKSFWQVVNWDIVSERFSKFYRK